MELPNKKLWAIYYKQIKKPQCLENIFVRGLYQCMPALLIYLQRRIKRKEYHTTAAFASDVEVVFSNAMSFNQDHTPIWEDALALRVCCMVLLVNTFADHPQDYFRQLMSDLPPPHNLPEYPSKITNKIKIKPPAAQASIPSEAANSKPDNATSTLRLRVPAAGAVKTSKPVPTPVVETKLPSTAVAVPSATTSTTSITLNTPVAPQPRPPIQHSVPPANQPSTKTSQSGSTAQPATFAYSHYSHFYQPPQPTPGPSATPAIPAKAAPAPSSSPAPVPINPSRQIKYVKVRIQPQGRLFWLDYREGVRTWVLRLASGESEIDVDDLVFLADEEEEGSSDEDEDDFKLEDENDVDTDGPTSSAKNGRTRKGRSSTRRSQKTTPTNMRTTRSAAAVAKSKVLEKKKEEKIEEVQLKLNGTVVNEKQEATRQWNINLSSGSNTLEVGEKGGLMWKVYIERLAD
jgi:chromatin structure-remodeling complex subunit RSC4